MPARKSESAVRSGVRKARALPRPFAMHWGRGHIIEEAAWSGEYHEPAIQLMRYDDGEAAGTEALRFCYYNHAGHFQRGALIVGDDAIEGLRAALKATPRLRAHLRRLVR